jgi:hypothetical protein
VAARGTQTAEAVRRVSAEQFAAYGRELLQPVLDQSKACVKALAAAREAQAAAQAAAAQMRAQRRRAGALARSGGSHED